MIQSNLLKRFLTSIILLLVIFFSIKDQFVLYFMLLIFSFFNGLGGMALLAAFWGIWHIVSGLIIATYWSKRQI